jgi:hypothetical protein
MRVVEYHHRFGTSIKLDQRLRQESVRLHLLVEHLRGLIRDAPVDPPDGLCDIAPKHWRRAIE